MSNDALRRIWADWKNVIIVTVGVAVIITSLWWLPPVVSQFESDPAKIKSTSEQITNMLWFMIFIFAAQVIFSNRRKRAELKRKMEEAQREGTELGESEEGGADSLR